jgi:predicted nucleotidyltransferase
MSVDLISAERRERLASFCRKWGVSRLELFGSAGRGRLRADSDVDLLVSLREGREVSLFDWVTMKEELEEILGREVDLVSRRAVERSRNPYRREAILSATEALYVEG